MHDVLLYDEGNFRGGKIFMVFVVEGLTTNILPTNEATLLTFTCSASSNNENITHESLNIAEPRIFCPPKITRYTVLTAYMQCFHSDLLRNLKTW